MFTEEMETMRMAISGSIMAGIAAIALAFSACGPADDGAEVRVSTSESTDTDDTVVVQNPPTTVTNTVIEHQTDTVVREGVVVQQKTDTVVKVVPGATIVVSDAEKQDIDAWLTANKDMLNEYGDPKDMVYTGGTPLFNETTGKTMTKYEYIISQHPDRPWLK
jgi:hypothetical protein